ncbi:MAG: glycerate kinase [Burkholderiaceae bacterium]|nr:glycerate kinase [Burkholderiaceae bacterium]
MPARINAVAHRGRDSGIPALVRAVGNIDVALRLMKQADLVITAEGSLDEQTPFGKVPAEVARRAKLLGLPVVALAGTLGQGATANLEHGIDAFASIVHSPCPLEESMAHSRPWLARAAEDVMRLMCVGSRLRLQ